MQTKSSSKLSRDQTSNPTSSTNPTPKGQIRRSSKQKVENSNFEEHLPPVATVTDNHTMAEMLHAPTEGCAEAIVVPPILAEQFELKHSLINMMTSEQFFGLEKDNPHDHIRAARRWLEKEPPRSITTWDDLVSKFINEFFPPSRTTNLHQDSLNAAACGNLLEKSPQDALTIIENKSKQTSVVTTAMTAMLKQLQANPPPAQNSGIISKVTFQQPQATTIRGELKAVTNRNGLVADGPTVPTPPKSVTLEEYECVEETYTDLDLAEYTIKVPHPPVQKQTHKPPFQRNFILHTRDSPLLNILSHAKIQKMLKALLSNKEKLQELANTPLNENCSAVILKKLPKKLGDLGKFLVPCGFSLPDLIPTCMTLELANRAICTPDGIARDVFVLVGKFTFPADFVIFDYESNPRVPLILERSFLRTARALIDVHGEEMILRDGDERLTLNTKHDIASYSNHPHRESVNLINIFNVSSEDCLEVSVSNPTSGNPTFSLHKEITSPKVTHEIHASEGCNFLSEELPDIDSFNDIHPHFDDNPVSGSTTYSSNLLLEEFTNELALITYPPDYDDNLKFDIESDLREIEFLLYQDESDADNFYDDPFDSKGEKIKESKLLIDELDLPCDFLLYSEYDSFASQDFSRDDDLPSPNNKDKVKEKQEKDKIRSKSNKNVKRGKARQCRRPITFEKEEKIKKIQVQRTKRYKS
uniref:Reverse transcriptase domain-containing protein n=1 Tax=Tanacetum cinerariifolium TaxID=118510 RepID=A0A6L2K247_TANCI|nr:hypothetical protein [Tanacetum cinerariifolium]